MVVIGGVAAGTKAAAKAKRENPDLEVTVLEKGEHISYAGCGLPYFVGGIIKEGKDLLVRSPQDFNKDYGIVVLTHHEAYKILTEEKVVLARDTESGQEKAFSYDRLIIATGAKPVVPPIPGIDLKNVFTLRKPVDALKMRSALEKAEAEQRKLKALVVGGGLIGLEVAENMALRGASVTVVEMLDQILPGFDLEIAKIVENHMRDKGVNVLTDEKVNSFEGDREGFVIKAYTTKRTLDVDLVLWATGVKPDVTLAKEAGIALGPTGAIEVDENFETNVKGIYAVGDCAQTRNLLTGNPAFYPLGSTANKMGRVAGTRAARQSFLGTAKERSPLYVLGTGVAKIFDMAVARTGLSEQDARKNSFDAETVLVPAHDRAHYYPGHKFIITKLVVDKPTQRLLGAQIVGEGVVDKPIDVIATALTFGGTVGDLAAIDLAYAPPFSMALSSTIVAANVMLNKLSGRMTGISPVDLKRRLDEEKGKPGGSASRPFMVDVRTEAEFLTGTVPGAVNIPLSDIRRLKDVVRGAASELDLPDEARKLLRLPRETELILICRIGQRAYLAALELKRLGFLNCKVLDGGVMSYSFGLE
ncbi:MAG TPA: FAD-dependent oxidoreductase [Clostridia bacterium]|nr:FAD-dependent oxidoreductase [Clostridia bacterium]